MQKPGQVLLLTGFQELFFVHSQPLQPTEKVKENVIDIQHYFRLFNIVKKLEIKVKDIFCDF